MKIETLKEFIENSGYYAKLKSKLDKKNAEYDEKEKQRRQKFIEGMQQDVDNLKALEDALWDFADQNDETLFEGKKTYKNEFVTVTKRDSSSLGFVKGYNDEATVEVIKKKFKNFVDRFIKVTEKVDKPVIKSAIKSGELSNTQLAKLGMKTEEKTTLTIKPN